MISVLIPIYNFDVQNLVGQLVVQFEELSVPYEILLLDDFSERSYKELNSKLVKYKNVNYHELDSNIGRSKIRNKLAEMSQYEYLLFLDCDTQIHSKEFIQTYIQSISPDVVLSGGSIVTNETKTEENILRWTYELKKYQFYKKFPTKRHFVANNFFIAKKVFSQIKFNENLVSYGHEDTLFSIDLMDAGYDIKYILNPVVHVGLENNDVYLAKVECSILNLYKLENSYSQHKRLYEEVNLLKFMNFLSKTKLLYFVAVLFGSFRQNIKKNLLGKNPKIRYFNFYRIGYYCFLKAQPSQYAS